MFYKYLLSNFWLNVPPPLTEILATPLIQIYFPVKFEFLFNDLFWSFTGKVHYNCLECAPHWRLLRILPYFFYYELLFHF